MTKARGAGGGRCLDLGTVQCHLEADSPRVDCPAHGPTVAQVPWARHDAGHTRAFDDQVAWLVTHTPKSAVSELMRVAWRTVGSVIARVVADGRAAHDPFCRLRRIGIDEISYKRGHRYLTVVVDHDSGRLVWAAVGRDKKTLRGFFDLLGEERCDKITVVSADGAEWIADVVRQRCRQATLCIDSFHVMQWATDALDEVRREVWNAARRGGMTEHARELKGARFALWKNPEDLTRRQQGKLAQVAKTNSPLYRAYLMKASRDPAQGHHLAHDARLLALLGRPLPHPGLRRARPEDPPPSPGHRSGDAPQHLERARRKYEYEVALAPSDGVRLPRTRTPDRPRAARPRWILPAVARPFSPDACGAFLSSVGTGSPGA